MASKRYPNRSCTSRILPIIAIVSFLAMTRFIAAQEQPQPAPPRFEVTPMWGFRSGMSFPVQPSVNGTNLHISLDPGQTYGLSFGVHIRDDAAIQVSWMRQDSYARVQGAGIATRQTIDRFHCNFVHEYGATNDIRHLTLFVMSGVGVTRIQSTFSNPTQLSFGIGMGGRTLFTPHLGFQVQAEWLPVFLQPRSSGSCTSACFLHIGGTLASQVGFTMGPILRF